MTVKNDPLKSIVKVKLEGLQPFAVSEQTSNIDSAIDENTLVKLDRYIQNIYGKRQQH